MAGECFEYPLRLAKGGARLRVAIDTPSREDSFQFQLIDPAGGVAASQSNSNQFNEEAFVSTPAAGRWTVRVVPKGAKLAFFRMRAKLEAAVPKPPRGTVALLPNLKAVPPYEFGFIAPANPLNGVYPPDTVNPPLDAGGVHPLSCTADEMAPPEAGGFAARRCLRLTSGPINTGRGPYDMRFTLVDDLGTGEGQVDPGVSTIARGPMFQVVHYSDGSSKRRAAGTYSFHTTHAHFHDDGVLTYELFSANPARRTLVRAGDGSKSGFCPADQLFGEWWDFRQQPSGYFGEGDSPGGNCFSASDGFLGLTVGWGDVYRWQRPGQYVEFGENPDGLYVVRSTVDRGDDVLETSESDNSAYALIRVVGERVDLLERGQGSSPYDRRKKVFEGPGPAGYRGGKASGAAAAPGPARRSPPRGGAGRGRGRPAPAGASRPASAPARAERVP